MDSTGFGVSQKNHSVSDPRRGTQRNPLDVHVGPMKKRFEAVDPFASNNPYKVSPQQSAPMSIGNSKLRQQMGLSGNLFDFYGDQLKQSGHIKVRPQAIGDLGASPGKQKKSNQIKPKKMSEELDLFSGAFNKYNFVNKKPAQNIGEQLPQINVKPLDIVEPQMLGKSSLMGKSVGSIQNKMDAHPNDFEPKNLKKTNSEKALLDAPAEMEPKNRTSEGGQREAPLQYSTETTPLAPEIKWKTIFKSQILPVHIFDLEDRSLPAPWIKQSPAKEPTPTPEQVEAKNDSNISTGYSQHQSQGSFQEPEPVQSAPQPKAEPVQQPKTEPAPPPPEPKKPITIESIFKKYRQMNKTVTKIVHKKNGRRTEKWVYFSDGTSVLEDPGEDPEEQPKGNANQPFIPQQSPQPGHPPQQPQPINNNQMQPSNVYFYDHSNLVAEFDPENPNNIAMTLYEITTLQQKHMYCKYFDPEPDAKFKELAAVIDFSLTGNPSVYHQLDQLNDEHLLQPVRVEAEPEKPSNYWTKSLRKSNKRLISKKKNKMISKKHTPVIHD